MRTLDLSVLKAVRAIACHGSHPAPYTPLPMTRRRRSARILLLCALLVGGCATGGVDHDWQAWGAVFGQGDLGRVTPSLKGVRWWLDVQGRYADSAANTTIVRPGLGATVAKDATLWLGYAWVRSWLEDGGDIDEHRIWQQFLWSKPLAGSRFTTRTRLEQRFLESGDDVGWRLRQFFRFDLPFENSPGRFVCWDELFFDLNATDWGADSGLRQNRLFVGLGWDLDRDGHWRTEVGYLNQYHHRSSVADEMNHVLAVSFFVNY